MKSRLFQKSLITVTTSWLLIVQGHAQSIPPSKCLYDSQEVLWFSVAGSNLVTVSKSGIGVWDFASGEFRARFNLQSNDVVYPRKDPMLFQGGRMMLAIPTEREASISGKLFTTIALYDLFTKAERRELPVELVNPTSGGFSGKSSTLILADSPPNNATVVAMDVATGRALWRSETDDDVQSGTIVLADGQCYVNFCRDGHLRARNQSGKLIWEWRVPPKKFAEPGYDPHDTAAPCVVVYESDLEKDDGTGDLRALSAKDGTTVWQRPSVPFGALKAVSDDGELQAFFLHGCVEITNLSKRTNLRIVALRDDVDAHFSSDGRFLLCLPALAQVSENKTENSYTVARHAKILSVVDTQSGKIARQFPLTISAEKH